MQSYAEKAARAYLDAGLPDRTAVISGDHWRITVLTPSLVRLEWSPSGTFEDRPTQTVINRAFEPAEFTAEDSPERIIIRTASFNLSYDKGPFSPQGLTVNLTASSGGWHNYWRYGDEIENLGGTARTLDGVNGACPLEKGLVSMRGLAILDDSRSMALTGKGTGSIQSWIEPREAGYTDLYLFGYGAHFAESVRDFYRLTGFPPLLPRWTLGNWWSRYYKYSEEEYLALMDSFAQQNLPFSVAVIDMDWHLVDIDSRYGVGWTGYTWNRDLFSDPPRFLKRLHERGLKASLNVHPADGIRAYEEPYEHTSRALGRDPAKELPIEFDPADPHFMDAYFKEVHHPIEDEGVDFWWVDWQQGSRSKIEGLDPLWILNHYHYLDSMRRGKRALTFSRYAGPGSHRYPIGFSGDTHVTWESLKFQPYFTATASNIGYGWWSHDIGGHMFGKRDDELAARWVQFGVFSPINRLHSTCNEFNRKEPWLFGPASRLVIERFLRLRHALIPYLYTMNRIASREGIPLIRPMYWLETTHPEAYEVPNQYAFGSELLCAPITEPCDPASLTAEARVRLPAGDWFDFFSGMRYRGDRTISVWRPLEDIPVFACAGAVIPLTDTERAGFASENPQSLLVIVFPGAECSFSLWEDEGDSAEDRDENWAHTLLSNTKPAFTVSAATGNTAVLPQMREWSFEFRGVKENSVRLFVNGSPVQADWHYEAGCLTVHAGRYAVQDDIRLEFACPLEPAEADLESAAFSVLNRAQIDYELKTRLMALIRSQGRAAAASIFAEHPAPALAQTLTEILTAT